MNTCFRSLQYALVALIIGISSLFLNSAEALPTPLTLKIDSQAPDFKLPGVDGRDWSLKDFSKAKVLVVLFSCNHCPTAQYYEDRIKSFVSDYKPKGVELVAISPNDPRSVRLDELGWTDLSDSFEEMKVRAKDRNYNFPYLYDGDTESISKRYGPVATPHVFVFDSARKLRYAGAIDDSERVQHVSKHYLRNAVDSVLANQEVSPVQTKVIGCSVKWGGKYESVKAYMERLAREPVELKPIDADGLKALRKNDSGKLRLVTFWATWCAPCVAEFHEFVTMNRMYRHREFELVTVSLNRPDESKQALEFLKKHQSSMQNFIFASSDREALINAFEPEWQGPVPYTVLINPEGKIIHREMGSIDALNLKRAIVKELNARKPW